MPVEISWAQIFGKPLLADVHNVQQMLTAEETAVNVR